MISIFLSLAYLVMDATSNNNLCIPAVEVYHDGYYDCIAFDEESDPMKVFTKMGPGSEENEYYCFFDINTNNIDQYIDWDCVRYANYEVIHNFHVQKSGRGHFQGRVSVPCGSYTDFYFYVRGQYDLIIDIVHFRLRCAPLKKN